MWTRFATWYRQQGRALQVGVGCAAVLVVCILCTLGTASLSATGLLGNALATTAATATAPATATATATTAAPQSAAITTAVLGGPAQAFITRYGPLTSQSDQTRGDLHFREYPGVAQDYLIVDTGVYYGITPGDNAAYSILVSAPPEQPWTFTTAKQACAVFLPSDARQRKHDPTTDGWDDVYQSATLGTTFAASAFQDANQNAAPVGSFDVLYLYASASDTAHVASCDLFVGEQQTHG